MRKAKEDPHLHPEKLSLDRNAAKGENKWLSMKEIYGNLSIRQLLTPHPPAPLPSSCSRTSMDAHRNGRGHFTCTFPENLQCCLFFPTDPATPFGLLGPVLCLRERRHCGRHLEHYLGPRDGNHGSMTGVSGHLSPVAVQTSLV